MKKHEKVLGLIGSIKVSHPDMEKIFLQGGCYNFYLILKSVFSDAEAWYDRDHIITKIGAKYYDIRGQVKPDDKYMRFADYFNAETTEKLIQNFLNQDKWKERRLQ